MSFRKSFLLGCCALLGLSASGCASLTNTLESLPRDQQGWTAQIQQDRVLEVGVSQPSKQDQPIAEREKQIVQQLALRLGARVQWKEGNAHTLLDDLEHRRLPVVIAQLTNDSPFAEKLGFSQTIYTRQSDKTEYSIAVAPGENRLLLLLDQVIAENKNESQGGER